MVLGSPALGFQLGHQLVLLVALQGQLSHESLVEFHLGSSLQLLLLVENHQLFVCLLALYANSLLHSVQTGGLRIHSLAHLLAQLLDSGYVRRVGRKLRVRRGIDSLLRKGSGQHETWPGTRRQGSGQSVFFHGRGKRGV
jgi:hypothetical protein